VLFRSVTIDPPNNNDSENSMNKYFLFLNYCNTDIDFSEKVILKIYCELFRHIAPHHKSYFFKKDKLRTILPNELSIGLKGEELVVFTAKSISKIPLDMYYPSSDQLKSCITGPNRAALKRSFPL
jgi:hypothetical protein